MKKQLQNKTVYEPNNRAKITVVNKPLVDEVTGEQLGYDTQVTIKYLVPRLEKELKFSTDDDIADFIGTLDVTDPQQSLLKGAK